MPWRTWVATDACCCWKAASRPCTIAGNELAMTCSLASSVYPRDHTVLKHADTAMYRGKHEGRNTDQRCSNPTGWLPSRSGLAW